MAVRTVEVAFLGNTRQLEAALARAGLVAEDSGKKIGDSFNAGTDRAAGGLHRLSSLGASWGIPFMGSLDGIGKKLDEAHTKTGRFSTALAEAGRVTLLAGTAGFAGAAAEAVKLGQAFQTSTASIAANAGITQRAADGIGRAFLGTAGHSIFSGQQMASAFASVAGQLKITEGAALTAGQSLRVMTAAGDLAEATHQSLATSTAALAQTMQAYHLSVGQASAASDALYNVSKSLNVPVDSVSTALGRLHSRLGSLAPSLHDTATLMVEMGQHGITGTRGIMVANTALQTLVGGSKKTADVLQAMGVHLFDSQGKFIGLQGAIQQLAPKFAQMTQQQQLFAAQTIFGKGAAQAMLQVVQGGIPAYEAAAAAATKVGTAHRAASLQGKTLHDQMETLKATVSDLGTKFGLFLIPKLEDVGRALSSGIQWLERHKAAAAALAQVVGGVLGLAVAAFAYQKAVAFTGATKAMFNGVGTLAKGVTSAATSMAAKFGLVGTSATAMEGEVVAADEGIVASADTTAAGVDTAMGSTGIGAVIVGLGLAAVEMGTHWGTVMDGMKTAVNVMVAVAETALNGLIDALNAAISAYNATIGQITGSIGKVGHVGGGGGSLPASYGTPTLSGSGNAGKIANFLHGQGFANNAIAGILGNFAQENGGQTLSGISTSNTPGGLGIAQWIGLRAANVQSIASREHKSPTDLAVQLQYLIQELRGPYHSTFTAIQHAKSPQQAADLFEKMFEGAGIPNLPVREQQAAAALKMITGGGSGAPSASPATPGSAAVQSLLHQASGGPGVAAIQGLLQKAGAGTTRVKKATHHAAKAVRSLLYANPLPGMTSVGRTDEGVDFSATPGSAVDAIGAGVIDKIIPNWYKGQPLVEERLTAGPDKGRDVYYAEQLKAAVRQGQHLVAGQRIGTVAAHGTGLELGFGAGGGRTLAQATTGYTEGQVTPAGQAFSRFYGTLQHGIYTTTKGGVTTGGGSNISLTLGQLQQAFFSAIQKSGQSTLDKYSNLEQSGTVKSLAAALGVSTGGTIGTGRHRQSVSSLLAGEVHGLGASASMQSIDSALSGTLNRTAAGSQQEKSFDKLVAQLRATHQAGLVQMANQLVAAHKAALATLAERVYAEQVTKDAEQTQLYATWLKDFTTLTQNADADQLNVAKAQQQAVIDRMEAQLTAIRDMTQTITDQFAGMVQRVQDATQQMADASGAVVTGISDQTQIQVDILGERGLYGLNLIAQKMTVQYDILKQGFDAQIAAAQANVDATKSLWDSAQQQAQRQLDQVTMDQNQLVALAQASDDAVKIQTAIKIASAQAQLDAVTLHEDVSVVGPAQAAVDLGATLPQAQQDVLGAQLKSAQAQAQAMTNAAGATLAKATDAANASVNAADYALQGAQETASTMIGNAQQTLATVTGEGALAIATATQALQSVQDTAAQQEAIAQGAIDVMKATANTQFAGTGTTVNIYGIPVDNAAAVGNALDWVARTQLN